MTGLGRGAATGRGQAFTARASGARAFAARHSLLLTGLGLFALALLARLYRLDAQSLWLDEGSSWQMARQPWSALLLDLARPNAAYPLYHLLLKAWVALFGDGEAALRMPSALAGAAAVPMIYLAAVELERMRGTGGQGDRASGFSWPGLGAALIALAAPFAIWYSQEAKVYSLLLLCAALVVWAVPRALRVSQEARGAGRATGVMWRAWLLVGAVALVALFVHRLAVLLVAATAWAAALDWVLRRPRGRAAWGALLAPAALSGLLILAMVRGLGGEQAASRAAAGAAIPAGPLSALGLTFSRFSLDRWPGDAPWWWLLPWVALLAWGLARLGRDLLGPDRRPATALLCLLATPVGLFLAQLVVTRQYEARYLIAAYPAFALALAWPLGQWGARRRAGGGGPVFGAAGAPEKRGMGPAEARGARPGAWAAAGLLALCLLSGGLALFQAPFGLFSGEPVKEQYREAIGELAVRVHPDDAVVIHPSYLRPLYDYYMGRLNADPAPEPIGFADFWQGETSYGAREWDIERRAKLAGYLRSFLLIAPDHARTVDRPRPGDEYGLVGLFWAYSRETARAWPCGIWRRNGAHLLCQEAPEPYYTEAPAPQPATTSGARFGDSLRFLGFTLKATTPAGPGVYRAGGNLPISLFWDVDAPLDEDLSFFLHLCQDCTLPPAASDDGPPLEGYLPTSSWLPGKPARDDRAIHLPPDLPPGRYTLLLGAYRPADPTEAGRLAASGPGAAGNGRLALGTVEIVAGDE